MPQVPAAELAARETARWRGESAECRKARTALLAEEIVLRRPIETVAEQRRALPPGSKVMREDPRGAPDLTPLWTILDCAPEGRGTDWYPSLNY